MMRIVSDLRHHNNEWYEELCALSAIGELSSSEHEELQQHLAQCDDCRELYAEFRRIAADDLGGVAVLKRSEQAATEAGMAINEDELLGRLLDRAAREPAPARRTNELTPENERTSVAVSRFMQILHWLQRPALSYGTVALLLCAVATIGGFRIRELQLAPALQDLSAQVISWKNRAATVEAKEKSVSETLKQEREEQLVLQKLLVETKRRYAQLENERDGYQAQVDGLRAQLDERGREAEAARVSDADKIKLLAELEAKLGDLNLRAEQQDLAIHTLRNKLWQERSKKDEAQSFDDAEARELFGARDLHIVDVYDVGSNGKNRRTYGRVYYVAKKLLIFYAFDLQDKKRNRVAAGFQAWGYRQPNESAPQNLGLFTLDDGTENRWVLKVNNPRVLERIDAVFVTLETPNGSPSPRGRRILYANLAGPANHP